MHIERIRLKNFKVFQDITLERVPRFVVLVGANGTGKSTLFEVFAFLKDCLKDNVRSALQKRGGFREVVSRGHESEAIEIELQVRMTIGTKERLVTYVLEIVQENGQPRVRREVLRYKRGAYGAPFLFLDFTNGEGKAITNESEFAEDTELTTELQKLDSPDILAIKGLGQFQKFIAASAFRSLIENWQVSDFHIQSAQQSRDAGYAEHLSPEGDNLPLVAQYLNEQHKELFAAILKRMAYRVPGIAHVAAVTTQDGRVVLQFKDGSFRDPFISRAVSDGTIKMFAYLVLLFDPSPHPLLCVEEPENQLYPALLAELAEEFADYAKRGGQVFVSTHSPDFLNAVPLSAIFILGKSSGITSVRRAMDDPNLAALVAAGDPPGRLWRQKLFMGADPS